MNRSAFPLVWGRYGRVRLSLIAWVLSELRALGLFDARSKVSLTSICIRAFRIYCFCDGEYWGFSGLSAEF